MDHAGALLIGVAFLWLFGRILAACAHRDAVRSVMRQHYRNREAELRPLSTRLLQKLNQLSGHVDARLRLAAGIAVAVAVIGAGPPTLQSYLGEESTVGKALGVTLRWALMAGCIHSLRKAVTGRRQRNETPAASR